MCRMLGITHFDLDRHSELIDRFCELTHNGVVMAEDPPGHEDGWGLILYRDGKLFMEKSGGNLLDEKVRLMDILHETPQTPVLILHLRKSAWKNSSNARHAHPFGYGNLALVHNGVVYGYEKLLPEITIPGLEADALDTEVFFYHIANGTQHSEPAYAFLNTVSLIKAEYRYSALNVLFSDGVKLYAYRDSSKEPDYYTLFAARDAHSVYVCSEPLLQSLSWRPMEQEEFLEIPAQT